MDKNRMYLLIEHMDGSFAYHVTQKFHEDKEKFNAFWEELSKYGGATVVSSLEMYAELGPFKRIRSRKMFVAIAKKYKEEGKRI